MVHNILDWIVASLATGFVVLIALYALCRTHPWRFRILKWTTFSLATGFVVLIALYALYRTDAWDFGKVANGFRYGYRTDFTYIGERAERIVVLASPRLVADYYAASDSRPFILLVHGSTRHGRRSAFTRLLANRLHADGFPVLALDLRGFGESEDPPLPLTEVFRFEEDVLAAARYVLENGLAPLEQLVYMGFSLGAGVVLRAGHLEPRPAAIIAAGAPEKPYLEGSGETWRRRFAGERFRDMEMTPDEQSLKVMERYLIEMEVVTQVSRGDLPPVLLIYGEREKRAPYVRKHLSASPMPYKLYMVPQAPHSYYVFGGSWGIVFYNQEMLDAVVTAVENWTLRWSR